MNDIFKKRLKADSPDTSVVDEPEECTIVPEQSKGETR